MTLCYPDDAAVDRIGHGLLDRSLPKAEWTHAAHFAATLWLLRYRPDWPLATRMPELIRAYNEAVGGVNSDTEGYHETITQASLAAARRIHAAHPEAPLHEVVDRLMETPLGRSDWLLAHWSRTLLFSVEARRSWIPPDLAPLPD